MKCYEEQLEKQRLRKIANRKRKQMAALVVLVLVLGMIGGTFAAYNGTTQAVNTMMTPIGGVSLREVFNPADKWVPGETKQKEVHMGNDQKIEQVIRFRVLENWYDASNNAWAYTGTYNPAPATINWTSEITGSSATWEKHTDGYFYYKKVLTAGAQTPNVMSGVTFSPAIANGGVGQVDDFSDKRYSLIIEMEALEVNSDQTTQEWQRSFARTGNVIAWS